MARGMCDDCFWQIQCQYSIEHPEEWVGECYDEDGGLEYSPIKGFYRS